MADDKKLWDDEGPVSQGKIITAVMQGRIADARQMLHGWTVDDLTSLDVATRALSMMVNQEKTIRFGARFR